MQNGKGIGLRIVCCFALLGFWALAQVGSVALAQGAAVLANTDCVKCHARQPQEIEANGAAHKTQIGCQDCHTGHRPSSANNIPQCSMCHDGQEHFKLQGCTGCHNPHSPLQIVLKGDLKAPCLTCHVDQNAQLEANPSKHTTFACNFCHAERHGVIPECVQCHEPHSAQMTQADCGKCHQAHQPLVVTYGAETPNSSCGACHSGAYQLLAASKYKHKDVACVTCHQNKHKTIPQCSDCHGLPHAEGIHKKFPKCGDCHNIAHDLNK